MTRERRRQGLNTARYWFHAKRYGWGWSFPATWEGWLDITASLVAVLFTSRSLMPRHPLEFALALLGLSGALVLIGYWKGEPPGWRWGR